MGARTLLGWLKKISFIIKVFYKKKPDTFREFVRFVAERMIRFFQP